MSKLQQPVIGYTLGDQAGIGPEVVSAALCRLSRRAEFRPMGATLDIQPGIPTEKSAYAALEQLERAAEALKDGSIDAVVTAPVCKENLHRVGFRFPGQTEFFAERLGVKNFAMCLTGKHLTVALTTTHLALKQVPLQLTAQDIVRVGSLLADFLKRTGESRPRIAVAGLNPHNGESGAFGDEEARIIAPAVSELSRISGVEFIGPCVPDTVYREAAAGKYSAVVAPYHDQALIPLKMLDFDNAVNATLGLPRLRVSPDHGTAFGIAGKGIADPSSTIRAFEVALKSVH